MKGILSFLLTVSGLLASQTISAQEFYLRFIEKDIKRVNTVVTQTLSINNLVGDTVYAYANTLELKRIQELGYDIDILPHPSSHTKNRVMATTIEEMANWDRYPTYEVYREMMKKFEADYPNLCKLDSIGTTVEGRMIYVVKISDNVLDDEPEPEFFYTSTMHGVETTGYVLMLRLIDHLLSNYETDQRVTDMVNNLAIYINPNANPDGTYLAGDHTVDGAIRGNANNIDINRNFPDPRIGENPDGKAYQPETIAMKEFAESRNFALSANIHGGIELVNFPWDTWTSSQNPHADHSWFYTISREYATFAQANSPDGYFTGRYNGVTHGGDWYVITGGRQDYMNYWHNCREVTLEISNTMNPSSDQLPNFWNYNKEALLSYIEWLYTGIQGTVANSAGQALNAVISIEGHDKDNSHVVTNSQHGNYIRMIEPGTYQVNFASSGYVSQVHTVGLNSYTALVELDVVLEASGETSLAGLVTDELTGLPIEGARVELYNTSIEIAYTNQEGEYSFEQLYENNYSIRVSKTGYFPQNIEQYLGGEGNTINFELAPADPESFEHEIPEGFTFSGGAWVRDNEVAYHGQYSMRSANIDHNQFTSMQITLDISDDSEITFARKVSSESNYDFLKFYIDGDELGSWSGELDWEEVPFHVNKGARTFTWEYTKDENTSSGSDCTWVDLIAFPQSYQEVVFIVTHDQVPVEGAQVEFVGNTEVSNSQGIASFPKILRKSNYHYSISRDGFETASGEMDVRYVDIEKKINLLSTVIAPINSDYQLKVWPNPFSQNLSIKFTLTEPTHVIAEIFTLTGSKLETIVNATLPQGENILVWESSLLNPKALSQGVLLLRITTEKHTTTKRLIFVSH